ncbi:MAG: hypothetical protein M3N23_03620 [Pseudomonadota bacterium]|nr:hypothetical protein [Pseudomonadota bacterium]
MLRNTEWVVRFLALSAAALGLTSLSIADAFAQSAATVGQEQATKSAGLHAMPDMSSDGNWPKFGLETIGSVEYAKTRSSDGPSRGPDTKLRLDSTFLLEFNDKLSVDGLFQFKPRQPLSADDPNNELYINQGPGRREGGKFKELYVRYGEYRIGKFVQDFGRAYALLPGAQAADFTEESEQGYEPSEMMGIERIHVLEDESDGWRQISVSAFMADKTVLHRSFPYDEGRIHLHDGGIGNTRLPENVMATWDVLRKPIGNWAQLDYQASVIRWGKTQGAERGEFWSTIGGNLNIPVHGSVDDTLRGRFGMIKLYTEAARRDNFSGVAGRTRDYLSGAASYLYGPWQANLTTTQRWTTDRVDSLKRDHLYTASLGYTLPSRTVIAFTLAREDVAGRGSSYAGLRITQTLTSCSKCVASERY